VAEARHSPIIADESMKSWVVEGAGGIGCVGRQRGDEGLDVAANLGREHSGASHIELVGDGQESEVSEVGPGQCDDVAGKAVGEGERCCAKAGVGPVASQAS
jgi:hypothetical protein